MDRIEIGTYKTNGLSTETRKSFPDTFQHIWRRFLKCILTYLYCTKCNEINICHLDVQKHVSYTGSHKIFLMYYGLCFGTAGNVFSFAFIGFSYFPTNLKNVFAFSLSVCSPVCARCNSQKYS